MAFLDNSGDIILDAVLTDVGRQKMAQGTFSITKFALGDDEIDYSLYNKTHPSGTAYYDLEIMQTPVMESFTQTNAGINYGLLTVTATDLLYLPVLEVNQKTSVTNTIVPKANFPNVYYIADNSTDTSTKLLLSTALGSTQYFTVSNSTSGPAILLEAGLNTKEFRGDTANRTTYLVNNNLIDNYFYVYYDNRFISSILGSDATNRFNNTDNGDGTPVLEYFLTTAATITTDLKLDNYSAARISGPSNGVVYNAAYSVDDRSVSSIDGPRSSFGLINVAIKASLDAEYSLYGSTNQNLFGDSKLYNYIDTTLYVQGSTTGVQIQIPLRLIKYISG